MILLAVQVLFQQAKLRNAPFEWVYDGLAPALLPQVLKRSKGMPLSLALVAAAVGRRLGMQLQLLCAPEGTGPSTASGKYAYSRGVCMHHSQLSVTVGPPEVWHNNTGQMDRSHCSTLSRACWLVPQLPSTKYSSYEEGLAGHSQRRLMQRIAWCKQTGPCIARNKPPLRRWTIDFVCAFTYDAGPLLQQQLPPEVAARQGARTTASAPSPDYWLLRLLPPAGHVWQQDQAGERLLPTPVLHSVKCSAVHSTMGNESRMTVAMLGAS